MAHNHSAHSSDDDDDDEAPETLTLTESKGAFRKRNAEIREVEEARKKMRKDKRRERERILKERKQQREREELKAVKRRRVSDDAEEEEDDGGEGDEEEDGENDVEKRMLRAMQQAEEEEDSENEVGNVEEGESVDEDYIDAETREDVDEDEEDKEMVVDEDDEDGNEYEDEEGSDLEMLSVDSSPPRSNSESTSNAKSSTPKLKTNHLPEHLFASAFSSGSQKNQSKNNNPSISGLYTTTKLQETKTRRRKRSGGIARDHIVGSRLFRTLPKPDTAPRASAAMVPSSKVNKFLDRSLSLKGDKKARMRGWERRAANIGSLRRQGPAAHFVRGASYIA
ncbi:hypothetical protein EV368DRAFT_84465 [Lentinula lateritia]|uniref:Uncharacterized protein n=1 Tax=Lentinula aff. lateritia TaxID=2804960 RepID=A0ACC1U5E3_9AGAR|nr:hypothetical protein F5876DRAFT_75381 [Lentinula aff. lateritia]KAJ3850515.1 hypothetical protein EV368DRAFT_84465 [Lentinula lateritia]